MVLAGPNGCGKSSLFDALHAWHKTAWRGVGGFDPAYCSKFIAGQPDLDWNQAIQVWVHNPQPSTEDERRKAIYVRSAYRNEPEFELSQLASVQPLLLSDRINRMIDNDATVKANYQRLASQGLSDLYEKKDGKTTFEEYREESIGALREAVKRLFPDLVLNSLGDPLVKGTFKFDKGQSKAFVYRNLSGGEKAAFDLLLDTIIKRREFDDTIFLIDEPEAHMNTRLQGALLAELYNLIPEKSQLWISTHSIGMMRKARDLWSADPTKIVFLDLDEKDFDQPQTLVPIKPTRVFWNRVLSVALDDLADLVAPSRVVICEGAPLGAGGTRKSIDARCYNAIFAEEFPDTRFLSGGNASDVETDRLALMEAIRALVGGANIVRVRDFDDLAPADVAAKKQQGVRVLSRRQVESFLYDDEVLTALCQKYNRAADIPAVLAARAAAISALAGRGKPPDDVKSAASDIYVATKRTLQLTQCGNDASSFMAETLAPLVHNGMKVYQDLKQDIGL